MSIIPCASQCKYQKEGYCTLSSTAEITNVNGECPYIVKPSADKLNSLADASNRN